MTELRRGISTRRLARAFGSTLASAGTVLYCSAVFSVVDAENKIPVPRIKPVQAETGQNARTGKTQSPFYGVRLTLADAVFLGLRKNRTIKSAYINRISEKFDLQVVEDTFTPHAVLSGEISRQRVGNTSSTAIDVSPEVNILTKTGAAFQFVWNNSASLSGSSDTFTSALALSAEQPLLRGAGVDVNMAPVKTARLAERVNHLRLKATVAETIATIIFAYRDLLSAQGQLTLAEEAVSRGEDLLKINQALISSGRMAKVEQVQTEADIARRKLGVLQRKRQVTLARFNLLNLLNLDLGTQVLAAESLNLRKVHTDIRRLIQIALAVRPDYQGQLNVIEQNRLGVVVAKNEQLWDLSMFADARFGKTFDTSAPAQDIAEVTAGLRFSIPVNDLTRKQSLVHANTSYQAAELQLVNIQAEIETQIRSSTSEITYLWEQINVALQSRDLAQRAIDIAKAKLKAGRSTTFEVRSAEDNLRAAENELLGSRIDYLNALTRLDLELGTTLETWHIGLSN